VHSSTKARRLSVLALLALGSAATVLVVGNAVGASAPDLRVVGADDLTGVVVPGEKVTWTWDEQD
jgi:hypothetical protein